MKASKWEALQKRVGLEAEETLRNNVTDGVAIVSVHMVVRHDGEPIAWVVQNGLRIEPSRDASVLITALLGQLGA